MYNIDSQGRVNLPNQLYKLAGITERNLMLVYVQKGVYKLTNKPLNEDKVLLLVTIDAKNRFILPAIIRRGKSNSVIAYVKGGELFFEFE